MNITWHGHSCFRLTERGMATVVTDPYNHKKIGYSDFVTRIVACCEPAAPDRVVIGLVLIVEGVSGIGSVPLEENYF